jgi:hypothetical protein
VVECFSPKVSSYLLSQSSSSQEMSDIQRMTMPSSRDDCASWAADLPFEVVGVLCESDSGGIWADRMTEWLDLDGERGNNRMSARWDKHMMHKVIKDAGVKGTAKGYVCSSQGEAVARAGEMGVMDKDDERGVVYDEQTLCVVKPRRGVASDRVFKCSTLQEVAAATEAIIGSMSFGDDEVIEDCLVQEYLPGIEVAVDTVTRNGETKVVAVWDYDKRPANDAPFVNFATRLVDGTFHPASEDEELPPLNSTALPSFSLKNSANRTSSLSSLSGLPRQARYVVVRKVCDYVTSALSALEYNWGMAHTEVKVQIPQGFRKAYAKGSFPSPTVRLIEVNARQHNAEWLPLTQACLGYNKMDVCAAAYLGDAEDDDDGEGRDGPAVDFNAGDGGGEGEGEKYGHKQALTWDMVPDTPRLLSPGRIVHLSAGKEGTLRRINHLEKIRKMESVVKVEVYEDVEDGKGITKTVDIRSEKGWIHMMHDDEELVEREYKVILELMETVFEVEEGNGGEEGLGEKALNQP